MNGNNHRTKQLKAQFRKAKRRIELGIAKPTDAVTVQRLKKELNYG